MLIIMMTIHHILLLLLLLHVVVVVVAAAAIVTIDMGRDRVKDASAHGRFPARGVLTTRTVGKRAIGGGDMIQRRKVVTWHDAA